MKKLLPFILLVFVLANCKKDEPELSNINGLVGKWKLTAYEVPSGETKIWEAVHQSQTDHFSFRSDGVMLDKDGLPRCCSPNILKVNGATFEVKADPSLPYNKSCELVNCAYCATWEIQLQGDEIIIAGCNNTSRTKYVRE